VYPRCGGLARHQKLVVACLIVPDTDGTPHQEGRTFGTRTDATRTDATRTDATRTDAVLELADWLGVAGGTHVAMARPGVYWTPVAKLLDGQCDRLVVKARHSTVVPGRTTDVKDGEWNAAVLRHGRRRASFVPDQPQRAVRERTRSRTSLVQQRRAAVNRLQQTLAGATSKLARVATDSRGAAGRQRLAALGAGGTDAGALAQLATGRVREQVPHLERARTGRLGAHPRCVRARQRAPIDCRDGQIEPGSGALAERLRPFPAVLDRLATMPGRGRRIAASVGAASGTDRPRFPTAGHLASWAGLCPGATERAGTRRSGTTRTGRPWRRMALSEAAHAASRPPTTALMAQDRRVAARRGRTTALVAVGHPLRVIVSDLLTRQSDDQALGGHSFAERERRAVERPLGRRLESLGDKVALAPVAASPPEGFSHQALDDVAERGALCAIEATYKRSVLNDEVALPPNL